MPPDSPLLATPWGSGLLLGCLFVFGTLLGSFANVVIYRLPLGKSLLWPGSHCPRCGRPIRWHDNVPVLGWLLLGGRCRDCRAPIAVRYPAVEALFGLVLAGLGWAEIVAPHGADLAGAGPGTGDWLRLACHLLLSGTLIVAALVEYDGGRVPVRLFATALIGGLGLQLAAEWLEPATALDGSAFWPGWPQSGPGLVLAGALAGGMAGLLLGGLAWPAISPLSGRDDARATLLALSTLGTLLGAVPVSVVAVSAALVDLVAAMIVRGWPSAVRVGWQSWLALLAIQWLVGARVAALKISGPQAGPLPIVLAAGAVVALVSLVDWLVRRGQGHPSPPTG